MDLLTVREADEVSCMSHKLSVPSAAKSVARARSPLRKVTNRLMLTYYRYEVTWGLYVMSYREKVVFNTILFILMGLLATACVFYLPFVAMRFASRLAFYLYGTLPVVEASRNVIYLISTTATSTSTAFFGHRAAEAAVNATARIEL